MDSKILNRINIDILLHIFEFTDFESSICFLLTCKRTYSTYEKYKKYFYKQLTLQILNDNFCKLDISYMESYGSDREEVFKTLLKLVPKIENPELRYCDYILYMIKNKLTSTWVFDNMLKKCKVTRDPRYLSHSFLVTSMNLDDFVLSTQDSSTLKKVLSQFTIHPDKIYDLYVIEFYKQGKLQLINVIIDYFVYKYCFKRFSEQNAHHFRKMIKGIITCGKDSEYPLRHVIKLIRKYNINVDYNSLILHSIKYDNLESLKMFHKLKGELNDASFLFIPKNVLASMLGYDKPDCLEYVCNLLKKMINCKQYIDVICQSISHSNLTDIYSKKLRYVNKYLTQHNRDIINEMLYVSNR